MATLAGPTRLPERLLRFFARYPPELYSARHTGITIPLTKKAAKQAAELRQPAAVLGEDGAVLYQYQQPTTVPESDSTSPTPTGTVLTLEGGVNASSPAPSNHFPPNPFLPRKNFATGRWAGANISLRRQAELVKLAKKHAVEDLLPPGHKSTAFKQQRLLEQGLRIRGTGEGQKVKGHKWERSMGTRLEKRRQAMENMPALIREWESVRKQPITMMQAGANDLCRKVTAEDGRSTPSRVLDWVLEPLFGFYAMDRCRFIKEMVGHFSHHHSLSPLSSSIFRVRHQRIHHDSSNIWSTSHVHIFLQNCGHSTGLLVPSPKTQLKPLCREDRNKEYYFAENKITTRDPKCSEKLLFHHLHLLFLTSLAAYLSHSNQGVSETSNVAVILHF